MYILKNFGFIVMNIEEEINISEDFARVKGQKIAKRVMEIAVAGGHNILMIGPPGSGKTMIARCVPSIMPNVLFDFFKINNT